MKIFCHVLQGGRGGGGVGSATFVTSCLAIPYTNPFLRRFTLKGENTSFRLDHLFIRERTQF